MAESYTLTDVTDDGRRITVVVSISDPPPAPVAAPMLGVQFHGTWDIYWTTEGRAMFARHLDALKANGVGLVRVDVGWSASQPTTAAPSATSTYNARVAATMKAATERGMRVLLTLHQSPAWARPNTGAEVKQFPTDLGAWQRWCEWASKTWKPLAFEVWNEPDLQEFTGIGDEAQRPVRYVPVLRAARAGLRAGDPAAVVVFGGPAQTDAPFIRRCYELGARGYFDVMAVHPYQGNQTKPPESTDLVGPERMTFFPEVLRAMADFGDAGVPVWWTEFGFSVHANPAGTATWQLGVADNATSADFLVRSFQLAERWPQIRVAIVYCAYKPLPGSGTAVAKNHQYGYRVIEADGTVLPQLTALGRYAATRTARRPL